MPSMQHISAWRRDVLPIVGTVKGMFVLRPNPARKRWDVVVDALQALWQLHPAL